MRSCLRLCAEFIHDLPVVAGLRIASFEKQRNPDYHITSDSNVSDKYFCFVQPGFNRLLTTFFSLRPYRPWVLFLARAKGSNLISVAGKYHENYQPDYFENGGYGYGIYLKGRGHNCPGAS